MFPLKTKSNESLIEQVFNLSTYRIEIVTDFLIELGMKPRNVKSRVLSRLVLKHM